MNKTSIQQLKCLFTLKFALCLCFLLPANAKAQTSNVTLDVRNSSLESAINEIEKQTRYLFLTSDDIDLSRSVSVTISDRPVSEALEQMLSGTDYSYRIESSNIILSRRQQLGPVTVTGTVYDNHGMPVIGGTVVVQGTMTGVTTGIDGGFAIQVPAPAETAVLLVSYMGYEPQEITVGNRTNITVTLQESAITVDDVVVTALGIKRSEKALSYNVQQVGSEELTRVKDANFINSLSGKVAGVTFNSSSSGIGGATKVVMRGTKSILQSSNALYVIDGVPMFNFGDEGGTEFDSKGTSEGIADLNPEDIESIQVLTGAAAAALYGSNAANGAVLITTKKGHVGATQVTVTSNTELLNPLSMPSFQNRYGTGNIYTGVDAPEMSWGRLLNSSNYYGYSPRSDYFQTGIIGTETVAVSRGTDKNQTYFSAGAVNSKGIVPNNAYDRYNFMFRNTTQLLDDKITLDFSGNYIIQYDRNMTNQGVYLNPLTSAYLFPRGDDWSDIKIFERWDPARKIYTQYWPSGAGGYVMQNPYWINYRNLRENSKDRFMMNLGLDYQILDWLSASGRIRIDNASNEYTDKRYASTNNQLTELSSNGYFGQTLSKEKQTYGDVLVSINKYFNHDITLNAHVGASISDVRFKGTNIQGPIRDTDQGDVQNGIANVFNLAQLSDVKTVREQLDWNEQTQSIYATAELGYKGTYYLTLTGRNDWPSQLAGPGSKNSSFFYPSVGGSVVVSQIVRMPELFSYLKLRGSYAEVGVAFERYLATSTYGWSNTTKSWESLTNYPIYDLKPERTKSWEVGLTARFLHNFDLDVTYYNSKTYNQTFDPGVSAGSGYSVIYIQDGSVLNRGVELSLKYGNRWGSWKWNSTFTFGTNHNEILEIGENSYNAITGEKLSIPYLDMGGLGQTAFILKKGGTLGDIYSKTDIARDYNGNYYIDDSGAISTATLSDPDSWIKLGSVLPKANLSWGNTVGWKNLDLSFMFTARLGGVVFSRTQAALDYYGVSEATAAARDAGGVTVNNGLNTLSAYNWYSVVAAGDAISQFYTYSATNVRLQEASISYTIPRDKLGGVVDMTISLVGRNLWMIYNKAPFDPESVASTGNYYQGIDYFMMPSTRSIGFNLRLKF
ncbi:MAG: SusC/RagA family TonB-linked outer membrane protein [Alistipes sp.]|nr:SusC/RagA family TonB-linked outer membrane protein [Alistipes sp.]